MTRQHAAGPCTQCTEIMSACPMLVWAQEVLRYGPQDYPAVAETSPTL